MKRNIAALLAEAEVPGSDSPGLDAESLLAHVLGKSRSYLFTWPQKEVSEPEIERFFILVLLSYCPFFCLSGWLNSRALSAGHGQVLLTGVPVKAMPPAVPLTVSV